MPKRIWLQRALGRAATFPVEGGVSGFLRYGLQCHIEELAELRRAYAELMRDRRPLIICANHLTYVDSVLLMYAFGRSDFYFRDYRRLPWNLPAAQYAKQPLFRLIGYLGKCLFIDRQGSKSHKNDILDVSRGLLQRGEILMIFPEGRRSRTGYLDERKPAYGLGKIISQLDECRVLCVYLRARGQSQLSNYPRFGSRFRVLTELAHYTATGDRREGPAITNDILRRLRGLEDRYFQETGEPAPRREPQALPLADAQT